MHIKLKLNVPTYVPGLTVWSMLDVYARPHNLTSVYFVNVMAVLVYYTLRVFTVILILQFIFRTE